MSRSSSTQRFNGVYKPTTTAEPAPISGPRGSQGGPAGDGAQLVIDPADDDEQQLVPPDNGSDRFRSQVGVREFLHRHMNEIRFEITVILAVIVSSLLVITELMFDIEYLERNADASRSIPRTLHIIILTLFSLFLVETGLRIYVMRLDYLRSKIEPFDGLICLITWTAEVVFIRDEGLSSAMGLLIIFRLWRVTKVLNGIVDSVRHAADQRIYRERRIREATQQHFQRYKQYSNAQEQEIFHLRALLDSHSVDSSGIARSYLADSGQQTVDVVPEATSAEGPPLLAFR